MNTGSALYIGKKHKICEDYSWSGSSPEPYILISDGCSSSPKTDFGSRILTKVSSDLLQNNLDFDSDEMLIEADEVRRILNLPQESLDATLLAAYVRGEKFKVLMCGDGVFVKTKDNGTMEIVLIEYPSGAPFYPNYSLNETRKSGYVSFFGLKRKVSRYLLNLDGTVENLVEKEDQDGIFYSEEGFCKDYKAISLMSDGVLSFYKVVERAVSTTIFKDDLSVSVNEVLLKLLDYKGFQGEFVERRFQKFRKDCEKMNWFHGDDVSLATIYLGKDQ